MPNSIRSAEGSRLNQNRKQEPGEDSEGANPWDIYPSHSSAYPSYSSASSADVKGYGAYDPWRSVKGEEQTGVQPDTLLDVPVVDVRQEDDVRSTSKSDSSAGDMDLIKPPSSSTEEQDMSQLELRFSDDNARSKEDEDENDRANKITEEAVAPLSAPDDWLIPPPPSSSESATSSNIVSADTGHHLDDTHDTLTFKTTTPSEDRLPESYPPPKRFNKTTQHPHQPQKQTNHAADITEAREDRVGAVEQERITPPMTNRSMESATAKNNLEDGVHAINSSMNRVTPLNRDVQQQQPSGDGERTRASGVIHAPRARQRTPRGSQGGQQHFQPIQTDSTSHSIPSHYDSQFASTLSTSLDTEYGPGMGTHSAFSGKSSETSDFHQHHHRRLPERHSTHRSQRTLHRVDSSGLSSQEDQKRRDASPTDSMYDDEDDQNQGPIWSAAKRLAQVLGANWTKTSHDDFEDQDYERDMHSSHSLSASSHQRTAASDPHSPAGNSANGGALRKAKISRSLMARTRSRADVDMVVQVAPRTPSLLSTVMNEESTARTEEFQSPLAGGRLATMRGENDDSTILMDAKVARKRTRVVQLLLFGLLGIVGGFFGSMFTQTSCHFATAYIYVNDNAQQPFKLHFGLWKYSPIDSVFQGYSYCSHYDNSFAWSASAAARWFGLVALVLGTISLCVLWIYLIMGTTSILAWQAAVYLLCASFLCQAFTFVFFHAEICNKNSCGLGPSAYSSIASCIVWILLAYEMHHNAPMLAIISVPNISNDPEGKRAVGEEGRRPALRLLRKLFMRRVPNSDSARKVPSLSTFAMQNQKIRPGAPTAHDEPYHRDRLRRGCGGTPYRPPDLA